MPRKSTRKRNAKSEEKKAETKMRRKMTTRKKRKIKSIWKLPPKINTEPKKNSFL